MNFKWSDTQIIGFLVTALILQILLLLWHLEVFQFSSQQQLTANQKVAGQIKTIENSLKRRPLDSLIWEETKAPESVFYFDSVLTLSESAAKIELNNGTQISLAENTLITIEPIEEGKSGEIRINFSQGNIKARNPYKETTIQDKKVSLKVAKNSDVEIFKSKSGQYEVQINQGKAEFNTKERTLKLGENDLLAINKNKIDRLKIDKALIWKDLNQKRFYTHQPASEVSLEWSGQAEQILIFQNGEISRTVDLRSSDQTKTLTLPKGEYRLALKNKDSQSLRLPVQVWEAETIQLLKPLPRNREKFGELEFIWSNNKKFSNFEVEIIVNGQSKRYPAKVNKVSIPFDLDADIEWGVWGVDSQGFKNPPGYFYQLYIRENPFAAPKLKKPKLKKDKQPPKTSWIEFLIPKAHAEEKNLEATFTWEAIPGADIYFIEISTSEDFRSPLLKTQTQTNQFQWKLTSEDEKYFWRVAAGDNQGRMGQFSQPTPVEWLVVKPVVAKPKPKPRPVAPKKPAPKVAKAEPVTRPQAPPPAASDEKNVSRKKRNLIKSAQIFWQPGYSFRNYQEDGITKANLSGLTLTNFSSLVAWNYSANWEIQTLLKISVNQYEPDPKDQFPFQENLKQNNYWLYSTLGQKNSSLQYGILVGQISDIKRIDFERLTTEDNFIFGPIVFYDWAAGKSRIAIISDGSGFGGVLNHRLLFNLWSDWLVGGIEAEAYYLGSEEDSQLSVEGSFLIGISF